MIVLIDVLMDKESASLPHPPLQMLNLIVNVFILSWDLHVLRLFVLITVVARENVVQRDASAHQDGPVMRVRSQRAHV